MDEIDFPGVVSQLQGENERLRLQLLKTRHRQSFDIDLSGVWGYCEKNYLKLYIMAMLVWLVIQAVQSLHGLFKGVSNA